MTSGKKNSQWLEELDDVLRAVSGAFLFGIPLLYTMEVWWIGSQVDALDMSLSLAATFILLIILDYGAGFRMNKKYVWSVSILDSLVALAVAIVCAALSLKIIGYLPSDLGLENMLGRITMEAIPFGIGVGISDHLVEGQKAQGEDPNRQQERQRGEEERTAEGKLHGTLVDMGATALGAVIVAFAIAPTEEILFIASRQSSLGILIIMSVSLVISYIIVFEASFVSESKRMQQRGIFQHPVFETVNSYLVSLMVSLFMLWLFKILGSDQSYQEWLNYVSVLGFPASIGGAAGRLAI
jgi:putative integral membrane protein (TIGR02587 family)